MKINSVPNLFIIGAPKAGTSAFVDGLSQLEGCFVPRVKEPRYFDAHVFYDYEEDYPCKSLDDYLGYYNSLEAKQSIYRIDGSVFNMYSTESIKNILLLSPDAKFVLLIRDPVSSVKSMYLQRMKYANPKKREISNSFKVCWQSLEQRKLGEGYPKGCRNKFLFRYDLLYSYELYIPALIELIPENNLLLIDYESFKNNSDTIYRKAIEFLSLDVKETPANRIVNPSNAKKNNLANYIIEKTIFYTSSLRSKLNLNGENVQFIKNYLSRAYIEKDIVIDVGDDIIRNEFNNTYTYLNDSIYKITSLLPGKTDTAFH